MTDTPTSKPHTPKALGMIVDALMYILLLTQMLYVFTGNTIHEFLGITFMLCVVVHIVLKRKWIKAVFKKGRKVSKARRFSDVVTLLLFLAILTLAVSSMGVSRVLFPWYKYVGSPALHTYLATTVLALSVVHGGMRGYFLAKSKKKVVVLIVLGAIAAVAIGLALVPYLNRHFKTVSITYSEKVAGRKITWNGGKTLVVYFTRLGNTDFDEDVDAVSGASLLKANGELMGSNQLLADMIVDAIGCEQTAITVTGEKYPSSYAATTSVAGKELSNKARPAIVPIDTSEYDSIILVYPLWWGTIPMPVATFLEQSDLSGKTIYAVATQGSTGYGSSISDIKKCAPDSEVVKVTSIYCDDIPNAREKIADLLEEAAK
ncbi:MAG: hypothetical protein J5752_11750 [Clostridiales bacterium]|nr:hypothetical protein [Clostridiales bacterium]